MKQLSLLLLALLPASLALVPSEKQKDLQSPTAEDHQNADTAQEGWDYFGEEVARKRRGAEGAAEGLEKEAMHRPKTPMKAAIRINQEMVDMTTTNSSDGLLIEDPPGIGLGHVLGRSGKRVFYLVCRFCFSCGPDHLHRWNQLQTVQDLPRLLHRGRPCVPEVQVVTSLDSPTSNNYIFKISIYTQLIFACLYMFQKLK